jgi:superfamily II DNA/RNA helicase
VRLKFDDVNKPKRIR